MENRWIAIEQKVQIPIWDNLIRNPASTANPPQRPPDTYLEQIVLICPECAAVLEPDVAHHGKYYCWRCKQYGIDQPDY